MDVAGLHRLQEVVSRAVQATTAEGVARVLTEEGTAVLGVTIGGVWLIDGDMLEVVHFAGAPTGPWQHVPLAGDSPLATCVRERRPLWLTTPAEYAQQFPGSQARMTSQIACTCLPLLVGDTAIGGAVFALSGEREFSPGERLALELIARQCAQAFDRIRLVESERAARRRFEVAARRMAALQAVAAQLAAARGLHEITRVMLDEAHRVIATSTCALWTIEGDHAVLVAQRGAPRHVVQAISRIPVADPGALASALRTRTPQYFESRGAAAAQGPLDESRWEVVESVAFIPLIAGERVHGVIGFGFAEPRGFDSGDREVVEMFAAHAAQAIARDRDDIAQRVLAEASSALAASLDAEAVLARVGELTVATFADWCFVDLVMPDGGIERKVVSHADPNDREIAARLRGLRTVNTTNVARVIATQQPFLTPQVTDAYIVEVARNPERIALMRRTGAKSALCVPMSVAGRAVGALTWVTRNRELDAADVRIAAQIARAGAAALESSRLYAAEAASARRLRKLYELSDALSSARTPEEVAGATVRLGSEAVGAISSMLWMRDGDGTLRVLGSASAPSWASDWTELPSDPDLPANRVLASGEALWVESAQQYQEQAAVIFESARKSGPVNAFALLPLVVGGQRAALLTLTFAGEHRFIPDERTFIHAIARSCEQALERAQLYANEATARAVAESASRSKDEFLAMLGHELRNPLAPIVTALDLMRMRSVTEGLRERGVIERQVSHLTRLVDDLLDISRITRGKIELRRTVDELIRAVEPAIDAVGPLLVQQRHQLSVDVPATGLPVDGDSARISQVVRNLLTNAAKFTPPGGRLAIGARADGDMIELTVRDNGRGIAHDLLPHVFEPFVQGAQSAERSGGGLGLGLAIVKNLVEVHGGTAAISSDGPERGTKVTVRLPLAQPMLPALESRATNAPNSRALRILVVDDNVDAAALLGDLLRCLGHEPVIVHDGPAALAAVEHEQPQLAILDIGLPGMDGYELARQIRARPELASVPVVALTGYGQASDRERTREAGFVEHLVKPIDLARLHEVVGRFSLD